jgi:DNA-binding transcriptional ArsR family regulator
VPRATIPAERRYLQTQGEVRAAMHRPSHLYVQKRVENIGSDGAMSDLSSDSREQAIAQGVDLLAAMANPARIAILGYVTQAEFSVGTLSERIGLSQSAMSQHLAKLREAGLVRARREAQTVFYSSSSVAVIMVLDTLQVIFDQPPVIQPMAS